MAGGFMRILVVEDEKDMNRIITGILEEEGYLVDRCYDGESAYDYIMMAEYDAVILDVMLPKMNGFDLIKKVRSQGNGTPVLFLTALDDVDNIVKGLDSGADDYVVKPFQVKELLARIRMIIRKQTEIHENVYTCGNLTVDYTNHKVYRGDTEIELSPKEFSVLLYLIRNQNIVVTREQIEANIWDFSREGSSNLVDVYIRYLRKKIDDGFETKLIQTIRGAGYVLKSE